MGYITSSLHVISLLLANVFPSLAITNRFEHGDVPPRTFRRHIGTSPFPDWELGLREAVYQALLRERHLHQNLREFLYSAPLLGHQNSATPFGDIAVLARGQLYSAPGGFQFIQDPYQNDCDECHNPPLKCGRVPCEDWRPQDHERLLALWTVKRVRHRDSTYGYRYELEYKVTPMSVVASGPFVTRNGNFDYSLPGHSFIVKADPRQADPTFQQIRNYPDKVYRSNPLNFDQWSADYNRPYFDAHYLPPPPPSPPGIDEYYDEDPHNVKDPNKYHNVLFGPDNRIKPPTTTKQTYEEDELFKNFMHTLSTKTSTTKNEELGTSTSKSAPQTSEFVLFPESHTTQRVATKTSTRSTSHTISQLSSPITTKTTFKHTTRFTIPLLPTIPIPTSLGTTPMLSKIPLTTHNGEVPTTKPLFVPTMIRFPTTSSTSKIPLFTRQSTRPTSTIRFSENPPYTRYSEPDPLYMTKVTPTLPTLTSTTYTTRSTKPTTRRHKTTENIDFDLFGDTQATTTTKHISKRPTFSSLDNRNIAPGEQVITIVNPPTIAPQTKEADETISAEQSSELTTHKHLSPEGKPTEKSYITINIRPSTRVQESTTSVMEHELTSNSTTKQSFTVSSQNRKSTVIDTTVSNTSPTRAKSTKTRTTTTVPLVHKMAPFTYRTPTSVKTDKLSTKTRTTPLSISTTTTVPLKQTLSTDVDTSRQPTTTLYTTVPTSDERTNILDSKETTIDREKTTSKETTVRKKVTTTSTATSASKETSTNNIITTDRETTYTTPSSETIFSSPSTQFISKTSIRNLESPSTAVSDFTTHPLEIYTITDETPTEMFETTTNLFRTMKPTKSSVATTSNMLPIPTTTFITTKATTPISKSSRRTTTPLSTTSKISSTKTSTRTSSKTTANTDDFLIEDASKSQNAKFEEDDFEADIFGSPKKDATLKLDKKDKPKVPASSKELDDIFGSQSKSQNNGSDDYRATNKPKIIFSNFYAPSTPTQAIRANNFVSAEMTSSVNDTNSATRKGKLMKSKPESPMRQSYSTSTSSVKANKKSNSRTPPDDFLSDEFEPTERAVSHEISSKRSAYTTMHQAESFTTTRASNTPKPENGTDNDNNKIFDHLTLSVVNHARSIDYLNSHNCSTTEQKYKRKTTYRVKKLRRRN